jgi:zinc/manganese transport system substrate-binding protein
VEVLPSYMIKVSRSDVYLKVGLSLDQWAAGIIDGSRNAKLKVVDCSQGITPLEKPTGRVSAEQGDVHPDGNPHYWLDPSNGVIIAKTIAEALIAVDPEGSATYQANLSRFEQEATRRLADWRERLQGAAAHPIVTYHRSWVYFTMAFGFKQAGYVEPIPGIPPTATHLREIVDIIKSQNVKLLLEESYYPADAGDYISRQTGVKVQVLDAACEGVGASDYLDHLEQIVKSVETAK